MIRHLVLWRLEPTGPGERAKLVRELRAGFEALPEHIEGVRAIRLDVNVAPTDNHDLCLTVELDDLAALARYQEHPAHRAVAARVGEVTSGRAACDIEL